MKKLMAFIIVALFPFFVFASEYSDQYTRIKLEANDDFIVLTRDNLKNNSNLTKLGITEEGMLDILVKSGIYFDIVKNDLSYEIVVVMPDVLLPVNNITGISDELLGTFKEEAAKKVGANISSVYKNKYDFIVVDYFDKDMGYYIVNYYTVVNSRGYNIQIQKKSEINEEERNVLKSIVDSVEFLDFDGNTNDVSPVNNETLNTKKPFDYKIIIYGAIIGAMAGLISYYASILLKKKRAK